jgi:hypothetical protein
MSTAVSILVLWLGVYRVWMLLAKDMITAPWRTRWLGYEDDGKRNRWPNPHPTIAEFWHCPWCLGFWLSLAILACYQANREWTTIMLSPFALSAAVAVTAVVFENKAKD